MRRSTPHLLSCTNDQWCIDYRVDGKRRREFHKSKSAAQQALKRINTKIRREGDEALSIPDSIRIAAVEGARRLEPFNKSLTQAVDFYLQHLEASQRSIPISQLVAEYLAAKERKDCSAVHQSDLRNRFAVFCKTFGDTPTRTLTAKQIESWLDGLGLQPVSTNNYRSRIYGLFSFAIRKGYMDKNPCEEIDKVAVVHEDPEIFTVEELTAVLAHASPDILPAIVIGAFAGVRTAERVRLTWEEIDIQRGYLTVGKKKSKTASRRTISMEPNLIAWLSPFQGRTGPVFSGDSPKFCYQLRKACIRAGLKRIPKNGLRHSFASMHIAKYGDAERVRGDMGHSTAGLLFSNYRQLVTPEVAERYFNIFPPKAVKNIISLVA